MDGGRLLRIRPINDSGVDEVPSMCACVWVCEMAMSK